MVKCTVYVTDRAYWKPMNEVFFANFGEAAPHRVSCIVHGLGSPDCIVEFDAADFLGTEPYRREPTPGDSNRSGRPYR